MAALLTDYLDESAELLANYAAPAAAILSHPIPPRPWDGALADEMTRYQTLLGAPKDVDGNAGVFITGQQPGIFTGPLYTIYKAITALQLSERATKDTNETFAPVYWVGGDDHDFDEISRVHLLTKHHSAVPLKLDAEANQPAVSIFRLPAQKELHALVDQAAAEAPGSEFAPSIAEFLHESLEASSNLSEWHARLMARLFRDTPLLIFTPELQAARKAAIPVFEREIEMPLDSTARLNEGGVRLEEAGYGAQVVKDGDNCNFFVEHKNMRCRVRYVDGNFLLPDTGEKFSPNAMLDWLHQEPERFTANVALRCVVQQHLFPVRAYVAGPGELAYWGQLKGVFEHFDTPMPIVYPRIRAVLTSLKTNKLLAKYGLRPEDLNLPVAALEETALRSGQQDPSLALLEKRRAALNEVLQGLQADFDALGKKGRGGAALAAQFSGQVQQSMVHLEQNLLRADKTRTETVRRQIARLTTELAPERKPQERYYTLFSWLFHYGWDLIPTLVEQLD
ncbi:MAG: bacillithiol biosynthesis cysteine-adding enzyme BshC, partial [Candidatus Hydrogenedentes bacterium]|nr:bacillithiol biosynthesis cysteine-adding enzyme BshC [Candidatus Hydrogenedentota bacterium]